MTGYKVVNLKLMVEELGEERTKELLSSFSCQFNEDVENFFTQKAVEFSKRSLSQTHIVYASYRGKAEIAGYFTLANKYITVKKNRLSGSLAKRIAKFAVYDPTIRSYTLSAPLIAQLGKNYTNGLNCLMTGDELLKLACDKVSKIQLELGGRVTYVECEDKPKLIEFYSSNGFCEFDRRTLDRDETGLAGEYLVQMLRYIH